MALALPLLPAATTAAQASPDPAILEHHQELLAETLTYARTATVPLHRGTLPGGTSKFDPQPTATLEVAGRHTGGVGASRYDVTLRGNLGTTFGTVSFAAADSAFGIKTVVITWPASNTKLLELRIDRVDDGLNLAGTLEVRKAYVKIHQEGAIHKTLGSVPIAVKQTAIQNTGWQDVADIVFYKHVAADFDPAPTIRLRTTGEEKTPVFESLHVRLVDADGTPVPDSENVHSGLGSVTSQPLQLADMATYKLQVRVDAVTEIGELVSADLVFEQTTTDPGGMRKSVAWYPSVTAPVDLTTESDLGFLFNGPAISAYRQRLAWTATGRLTSGSAAGVSLVETEGDQPRAVAGLTASQSAFTYSAGPEGVSGLFDSRPELPAGSLAELGSSGLRFAAELRDSDLPIIAVVFPGDKANTVFASQPVIAKVGDPKLDPNFGGEQGSGIDPASISVSVRDISTGDTQSLSAVLTADTLRSDPASLVPGRDYEATVSIEDNDGNLATSTTTFLAMESASATLPQITLDPAAPSQVIPGALEDTYVWDNVGVLRGALTVSLQQTAHTGDGVLWVDFAPSAATVSYTLGGMPNQVPPEETDLRSHSVAFSATSVGTVSVPVAGGNASIGSLSAVLPTGASEVTLSIDAPADAVRFAVCADPTAATEPCAPDPVLTFGERESDWRPWADLLDVDPYTLPEEVAALLGLGLPANRCQGTPPPLSVAIANLAGAMNQPDNDLNPDANLGSVASQAYARVIDCIATYVSLLPRFSGAYDGLPDDSLRAEWLAGTRDILSTLSSFPSVTLSSTPRCIDLEQYCYIQQGGDGSDTYEKKAILSVDSGGADTYNNNAGGAGTDRLPPISGWVPLAVALDQHKPGTASNDKYWPLQSGDPPTNGAANNGGIGILIDEAGDDWYCGLGFSMGSAFEGTGYLLDQGGADRYESFTGDWTEGDGLSECPRGSPPDLLRIGRSSKTNQGAGDRGFGFLVDSAGNDTYYDAGVFGMGVGAVGGVGVLRDDGGDDTYTVDAAEMAIGGCNPAEIRDPLFPATCPPTNGFTLGSGSTGGIGISLDGAGADDYVCSEHAPGHEPPLGTFTWGCLGAGTLGGVGISHDRGPGSDSFFVGAQRDVNHIVSFLPPEWPSGLGSGTWGDAHLNFPVQESVPAGGYFVNESLYATDDSYATNSCKGGGYGLAGSGLWLDKGGASDGYSFVCDPWVTFPGDGTARANDTTWVGESGEGKDELTVTGYGADRTS